MNATDRDLLNWTRDQRIALTVELTHVARKGGKEGTFAGLRGYIEHTGTRVQAFIPASSLGIRSRGMQNLGSLIHLEVQACITEIKDDNGRLSLVMSERAAAIEHAIAHREILPTQIVAVARPKGQDRVAGFRAGVRHGRFFETQAFFPVSQIGDRGVTADGYVKQFAYGVIVDRGNGSLVLSETEATHLAFERVSCFHRLWMTVQSVENDRVLLRQAPMRGVPLLAQIERRELAEMHTRETPTPRKGEEVLVTVLDKFTDGNGFANGVLKVTVDHSELWGNLRGFCVECQEMHGYNGVCENCGGCMYKRGHQIWDGDGSSVDGCFHRCETCGNREFWD